MIAVAVFQVGTLPQGETVEPVWAGARRIMPDMRQCPGCSLHRRGQAEDRKPFQNAPFCLEERLLTGRFKCFLWEPGRRTQ